MTILQLDVLLGVCVVGVGVGLPLVVIVTLQHISLLWADSATDQLLM